MRVIILKLKSKEAQVSRFELVKLLKQSTEPSRHTFYPNNDHFRYILNKLLFCECYVSKTIEVKNLKPNLNVNQIFKWKPNKNANTK